MPLQLSVLWLVGVYRGIWRYSGVQDLKVLALGVVLGAMAVAACVLMLRVPQIPRSVLILDPILLFFLLGGLRVGYRMFVEHQSFRLHDSSAKPVLARGR